LLGVADTEHGGWLYHHHWGRHFRLRMKYEDTEEPSQFCSQSTFLAQAVSVMFLQSSAKFHKAPLCRKKRHKSQTRRAFLNEFEKLFVILQRTIKLSCLIATKDVFLNRLWQGTNPRHAEYG